MKKLTTLILSVLLLGSVAVQAQLGVATYASSIVETQFTVNAQGTNGIAGMSLFNMATIGAVTLTNITVGYTNMTVVTTNSNTGVYGTNTAVQSYLLTNTVTQANFGAQVLKATLTNPSGVTNLVKWGTQITTNIPGTTSTGWRPIAPGQVVTYESVIPIGYLNAISAGSNTDVRTSTLQIELLSP